jgi:thiol-disulfide isomerase/thioredoxin
MKIIILAIIFFLWSGPVQASSHSCFYYFYSPDCVDCQQLEPLMNSLVEEYPTLQIRKMVASENEETLRFLFSKYNVDYSLWGVPVVFMGDSYWLGRQEIINNLRSKINDNVNYLCPVLPSSSSVDNLTGNSLPPRNFLLYSLLGAVVLFGFLSAWQRKRHL